MADADRELLFGLLAMKNGLIDENQLADGVRAWKSDQDQTLAEHLVSLGHLKEARRPVVEAIAALHIQAHDGQAERSLAAISASPNAQESMATLGEAGSGQTLTQLGTEVESGAREAASASADAPAPGSAPRGERFRRLRLHARGGLGAVYVAVDEELHREVALKQILEKHADDPVSRARFLLEAEVTGALEHPGIVPVYSLGTYADGRPYYAMRFIKGDSLKDAAGVYHGRQVVTDEDEGVLEEAVSGAQASTPGQRSLEFRRLLRRFLDVCNAMEYAHSRGILHRDIKPANIILGKHGETLVVDWGLAKAIGQADADGNVGEETLVPSSASGSAETLPGRAMGTPSFMSPEQAEGDLESLGPWSDVYCLGATLYYLLTGRPPVDGKLKAVLRAVKRGEFPPPRRINATIDRALEAVCLKAMAHDPAARYGSAKVLAEDIERWMADEPVSAWREPLSRRVRRWAKRNRTAVATVGVALLAGVIALSAVLVVQTQAKAEIADALNLETRANKALGVANGELTRSRAVVQERYELAVEAIKTFHTGVSEDFLLREEKFRNLRDRLLKSASDFYGKLSDLLSKENDVSSRRALAGANFELAGLTAKVGRNADALAAHRSVLAARRGLAGMPGADAKAQAEVGRSLTEVAGLLESAGKTTEAEASYREAEGLLSHVAASSPAISAALAACRSRMGGFLTSIGKNDEALAAYNTARADQEKLASTSGATPSARQELGDTINRIGRLLANTGKLREATEAYRAGLTIRKALVDADPSDTEFRNALAASYNNLGIMLWRTGRHKDAEAEYKTALAIREKLANDNPAVSEFRKQLQASHFNLGNLLRTTGRLNDAEALFRSALAIGGELVEANPTVPEFRRLLALNHHYLATVLKGTGRPHLAETEFRASLGILGALVAGNPAVTQYRSDLGSTHSELGVLLAESGRSRDAELEFRAAVKNDQELVKANPSVSEFRDRLATSHVNLGELLSEAGRLTESQPEYQAAESIFRDLSGANPNVTYFRFGLAYTQIRRGILLSQVGQLNHADASFRGAMELYQGLVNQSPKVPDYADGLASALTHVGDIASSLGRTAEARETYDRAIVIRERLAKDHPANPAYHSGLAYSLRRRGLARRDLADVGGAASDIQLAIALYDKLATRSRDEWFETACCHAATAGLAGLAGSEVSDATAAKEANQAMAVLRTAVAMGYHLAAAVRTEHALDPLRGRPDFRQLLMDLEMPAEPFAGSAPGR